MRKERITSKDNPKVKFAYEQKEAKGEYFLSEGYHLAEMAVLSGLAIQVFSLEAYPAEIDNYLVNEAIIKKLASSKKPEGIVTLSKKPTPRAIEGNRVLFLDEVSDPGNLGTLLRTALAFGYHDVILFKGASPYKAKAVAASQGAIYSLNIIETEDLSLLDALKKRGYRLIGTDLKSSIPLRSVQKAEKIVLILGNEARGVSKEVLEKADQNIRIEMDDIDSLNVAIAGAIAMYELS